MAERQAPLHVVIIPDGNRRWAEENNTSSVNGHYKGYERIGELVTEAKKTNIQVLTIWAFSTENWTRSKEEVSSLFIIINKGLKEIHKKSHIEKVRFVHLGRKDRLDEDTLKLITQIEEETKDYTDFCLCLAIDYGGEDEIRRAEEKWRLHTNPTQHISDFLDTSINGIPSPDFIIRTSGEYRTSGFMLLQSQYSEWYFEKCYFPDFDTALFHKALEIYSTRKRRFGK